VHDDGKNFYTPEIYEEPHDMAALLAEERQDNTAAIKNRLAKLITTGYVHVSHYDNLPLSGLEFFAHAKDRSHDPTLFQQSMWTRLALALHVSVSDGDYNLCEHREGHIHEDAVPLPTCLADSIRFMHFGCDFHVDWDFNGHSSRMFECNKGPDFSVHHYRDGKMKRDVAADIVTFMGFLGEFDGSAEHARKHRMTLVYDSQSFDPESAFEFLGSLKDVHVRRGGEAASARGGGKGEL
jgi:hypothetical protein